MFAHITHADDAALVAILLVGFISGVVLAVKAFKSATKRSK